MFNARFVAGVVGVFVYYIFFLLLCSFHVSALDYVIINQVYVDPIATEAGGEAVELFNPGLQAIDISGYKIATESSIADITIPQDTVINAQQYYLIADIGWNVLKDNASWPNADHQEAFTMYNTDSGIALLDKNNKTIDALGWGAKEMIPAELYESTPAQNPSVGKVLARANFSDTNSNINDFMVVLSDFHNSSTILNESLPDDGLPEDPDAGNDTPPADPFDYIEQGLPYVVNITSSKPAILSFNLSIDEGELAGYQVMPSPGKIKYVPLNVIVEDDDGVNDISTVTAIVTSPGVVKEFGLKKTGNESNKAYFTGNISIDYFNAPGQYDVLITANDNSDEKSEQSLDFEYLGIIAFDIDAEQLDFGKIKNNETKIIEGDALFGTLGPTIINIGNTPVEFGIYTPSEVLGKNKLEYSFGGKYYNTSSELSTSLQSNQTLDYGSNMTLPLNFKISLETYLKPDYYLGSLNIVGAAP